MHPIEEFLARSRVAGPDDVAALLDAAGRALGADAITLYLIDYQGTHLVPLAPDGTTPGQPVPVEGTLAGRAFSSGVGHDAITAAGPTRWHPLTDGASRLGVLEIIGTPASVPQTAGLADLTALLLVSRQGYGDVVERIRRRLPMELAAEIVWGLLPPISMQTDVVSVSGILEPCYEVGGDAFDYAINNGVLHLALFDAMGHGMRASSQATLMVNGYRNARRTGLDLLDTVHSLDSWLRNQLPEHYVTAILAELDLRTGRYRHVAAGHPAPLLLRGGRLVKTLPAPTALPIGLASEGVTVIEESLEPDDRLLFFTDGVSEARDSEGEFFGIQRLADFIGRALVDQVSLPETVRRLIQAILRHQAETLHDDATALLVHWPGDPERRANAVAG